jgi:signal transduction histidine kinase/CheY-like chemotaxis protein
MELHPILARSIKKSKVDISAVDEPVLQLINSINNAFYNNDRERNIADHAFDVSELEYQNINKTLQKEAEEKNEFIKSLKETIYQLEGNSPNSILITDTNNLSFIIEYLKKLVLKQKEFEKDLIKAKLFAEKSAMAKSDFLSIMSHEIRTPLNAIVGISHLLTPNKENKENIEALKFSSEHLLYLINDILDFSKLEQGTIQFQENPIYLKQLLEDLVKMNLINAKEKNNKLQIKIDPLIPEIITGDILRLKQVLGNLIANAVKFTEKGFILVDARLIKIELNNIHIKFSVKDNGIGIEHSKLGQIFEKFTQAESSIANQFGGTGLGLSISKKILQLQNSDIFVDSTLNEGSDFYFTLAFKMVTVNENTHAIIAKKNKINNTLAGAKILVVDDNKFNILVAKQFLSKWEATVFSCESGLKALEELSKNKIDLILMDLQMPEMDGFETAQKIHALNYNIPIIALTASSTTAIQEKVKQSVMCDFIAKPFNANEMFTTLCRHLTVNPMI